MNKRIQELIQQATRVIEPDDPDYRHEIFDKKLFAELILTEVISTIYRSDISDKKQEKLVDELAYKFGMKKTFRS